MKENLAIDKLLMKYKARLSYKQFNLLKRMRFDIKFYKLYELELDYDFKIYTDSDTINSNDSASESVVRELSVSISQRTYFILRLGTLHLNYL